jgi:PAS domain S-box-containing protein
MEKVRSMMLIFSEIQQSMRQYDNVEKIFQGITAKLLNLFQAGHVEIYQLAQFTDHHNGTGISGKSVADAIAPSYESCSQEQIENILREEYQWGQDIARQIIDLYNTGGARCEINLAEIFANKAYLLVPIVLLESNQENPLWGFLIVYQCKTLDGDFVQNAWDQDDVLMLQQIAMQMEITLQSESRQIILLEQLQESENACKTLLHSAEQYRFLVENIPNISYISPVSNSLEFGYMSPQLRSFLDVPVSEWDIEFSYSWAKHLHPDDSDRVQREYRHTIETGEPFCCEYRMITNDGSIIWVQDTARISLATDGKTKVLSGSIFDISDRKAIELKFKAIFNNTFQFVGLMDLTGTLLEANQTALDFGGITRDQVINKPLWETHWFSNCETTQNRLKQSISQAAQGEFIRYEVDVLNADQNMITIDFSIRPLKDESGQVILLIPEGRDISEFKTMEKALRKGESLLAEAQQVAKIGSWEWTVLADEIVWSQEMFNIFGLDSALAIPNYEEHLVFFTIPSQEKLRQKVQEALNTGTSYHIELELQIPQSDGSPRYVEAIGHAEYDDYGVVIRLYGTLQDISDYKLTEEKLMAGKLAEAENKSKGEFLAVMSHELRTPMNAVIGMTEILENTPLSRQQQQYVNTIRQGGEVLLSVINNILDFSRIESGHFELEERPFRLHKCIEEVLELMASRTAEKFIELIPFVSLDVPQQLIGDYSGLRQILVNLVSNAIKFTESGEIVVTVNSRLINRETNTYELQFEVRDTGIGIAPDAIARLFKAFSQADNSIARQYGGTGLGLAICKQLCELMGGEIGVSSNVGVGSTFSFSIQAQAIIEDLDATNAIAAELKDKRILSINTNPAFQQAIALYAQPWEMNIQAAYTATDALKLLITFNYDAVLIDRQLVEADGSEIDMVELAKSIQEIFPDLNLILLTPINEVIKENTNSIYFKDCITKPISPSKLYQAFLNVFTNPKTVTFSDQNPQLIPQPSSEADNILGGENFAKCYPYKILVVEDNPVNQRILLLMLENLGYQADVVENGQRAVNNFLSQSYDLIFMDIQMPIMDGLNATKSIRQMPNHQPWIIGLSANAFSESRDVALNTGMDDYLTKPLQTKSLIAALQRIPQQQDLFVDDSQPPIDLSILVGLEDSIGKENLDGLINVYLEHSASAIAKMNEAFAKQDFVTIEAENHALKGGSGTFGAIQLCNSCQALQSICITLINSNEHTNEDIAKIASLLKNIEEQYNHLYQIFQSREFN